MRRLNAEALKLQRPESGHGLDTVLEGDEPETFKEWLIDWHYTRVDFLDEQFGSDAVMGICVVTMFFCALQLLASWLCYDPSQSNFTYQGLHSAMAFALTITFGGIFLYLSNVCIKADLARPSVEGGLGMFPLCLQQAAHIETAQTWHHKPSRDLGCFSLN